MKNKVSVKFKEARKKAIELGYASMRDLEQKGTDAHKQLVKSTYEQVKN